MAEHYTKSTVEATLWCSKHGRMTQHKIQCGRRGPCIECLAKLEQEKRDREAQPPAAVQKGLFE